MLPLGLVFGLEKENSGKVKLNVYDVNGVLVKVLYNGHREAGVYEARWNGTNRRGQRVSSGIYFYRLQTKGFSETRKMLLTK